MKNNWSPDKENECLEESEEPGNEQLDLRRKTSFMNCVKMKMTRRFLIGEQIKKRTNIMKSQRIEVIIQEFAIFANPITQFILSGYFH